MVREVTDPNILNQLESSGLTEIQDPNLLAQLEGESETSDLGFLNRSLAQGLGLPVDLVTSGLNKAGMNIQAPIGGSQSFTDLFEALGAEVADSEERAETLGQQVASGTGEAASMLLPLGGAVKAYQGVTSAGKMAAKEAIERIGQRGLAVPVMETAAGAGAGAGGYVAEQFTDNPYGKMAGQFIGGGVTQPLVSLSKTPSNLVLKAGKKALKPFTMEGGKVRAKKRLNELVPKSEMDDVIKALDEGTISDLTPAQKSAQPKLLALEKEVLKKNWDIDKAFTEKSKNNTALLESKIIDMRGRGDIQVAKEFTENRVQRLSTALNTRVQQAIDLAEAKVSKLKPEMRESQASVVTAGELEKALKSARVQEGQLWQALPNIAVDITGSNDAYKNLLKQTPKAQRDDLPHIATRFLSAKGALGKVVKRKKTQQDTIKEVQGLRSKLLEEARRAKFDGNYNKARLSNNLADALLDDMSKSDGGKELQEAILYSRELNRKFNQGTVGRLLGAEKTGGDKVASELTLQSAIGAGNVKGSVGMDDIIQAADTPESKFAIEQYLKQNFQRDVIRDGLVRPDAAGKFIAKNKDLLDKFPSFRRDITNAIDSSNKLFKEQVREKAVNANLQSAKKSTAARFLNTNIGKEFDVIANDKNPTLMAKQLQKQAAKDTTGESSKGLKAGAVEFLMNQSRIGVIDEVGEQSLSGRKILHILNKKPKEYKAISPFLTESEVSRLKVIAKELIKIESSKTPSIGGIIQDTPNTILSTLARVAGAQAGGKFGAGSAGGSLQTAAIFSGRAKDFVEKVTKKFTSDKAEVLLMEAVQDPQLMKALLTDTTTQKGPRLANQRLNAWLAAVNYEEEEK